MPGGCLQSLHRKSFTAWSPSDAPQRASTDTQTLPRRLSQTQLSLQTPTVDPNKPTRRDGCDRAGLSPLARARGVRRRPRAQTLLLEHGDFTRITSVVRRHIIFKESKAYWPSILVPKLCDINSTYAMGDAPGPIHPFTRTCATAKTRITSRSRPC